MTALDDLFQFSPVPMWVYDAKTFNFLAVNQEAVKTYGYSRHEFLIMSALMLQPEADYNKEHVQHIKKNGEVILVSINSNTIEYEGTSAVLVAAADITSRVKAEQEAEDRYNIISKATSDTVWDWDLKTNKIVWNKGIKGIFGYKNLLDNTTTDSWWEMRVHPDDRERITGNIKKHVRDKVERWQEEYRFCCADDSYKYVQDRRFMVFDENGISTRIIGSIQDISKRKEEEQLSRLQASLHLQEIEAQNKKFKEIAWIQSHLVRAPLARVMGLVDLLRNFVPGDNKDEILLHLVNSAKELDAIIINIADKTP
ncbi:PAS domain S-box protein [Pedobacter sp. L105]|uniref:PAS domain-containing protein n=1 Tax=Pedobacter sp. L105 TaxID=1641871 RepID=UPI00131CB894|nr:PAS domain S-box protein [Pedobacter sp. L105]